MKQHTCSEIELTLVPTRNKPDNNVNGGQNRLPTLRLLWLYR